MKLKLICQFVNKDETEIDIIDVNTTKQELGGLTICGINQDGQERKIRLNDNSKMLDRDVWYWSWDIPSIDDENEDQDEYGVTIAYFI